MASIGSFVPKNLLKVLSSDPHRIPSIVIRCASTSQGGPSRPPIQTNPPQNNAATDSTDEKMDADAGGPYSPAVYEDY